MAGLFGQGVRDFAKSKKGGLYFENLAAGQNFGQAMGGARREMERTEAGRQALERQLQMDDLTRKYKEAQIRKMDRPQAPGDQPMNIREWDTYQKMSPEQQEQYLNMKRASRINFGDIAGVPTMTRAPQVTGAAPTQTPLSTLPEETAGASALARATAAGAGAGAQAVTGTPAQRAIDAGFAKEYVSWKVQGGSGDSDKQISQLRDVLKTLRTEDVTGPITGNVPDWMQNIINPEAINTRDLVEEVVQRNLRLILGPQFTEEEGKRLIARAYNPKLEEKDNIPRVERLLDQMILAKDAKDSASDYYEKNGTLRGWQGRLYTRMDDFMIEGEEKTVNWDDL